MGKTAYSGPVYGAKSLLWTATLGADSSGSTSSTISLGVGTIIVPSGEDWVISDVHVFRGSTGSTGFGATLTDDSTAIATIAVTSSVAGSIGSTRIAPTLGEYTGVLVASGSSLTMTFDDAIAASSFISRGTAWVYGFPRWLQSSTLGQGPGS